METSLQKQSVKILQSNLCILVADLLSFLSMKSPNDSGALNERTSEQFSQMLNWFSEGLSCLCLEHVKSINEKVTYSFPSFLFWLLLLLLSSVVWKGEWNFFFTAELFSFIAIRHLHCQIQLSLCRCHKVSYSASLQP